MVTRPTVRSAFHNESFGRLGSRVFFWSMSKWLWMSKIGTRFGHPWPINAVKWNQRLPAAQFLVATPPGATVARQLMGAGFVHCDPHEGNMPLVRSFPKMGVFGGPKNCGSQIGSQNEALVRRKEDMDSKLRAGLLKRCLLPM